MQDFDRDDMTKCLVEADEKYGTFEDDPNDPFIQRYIPSPNEELRLNGWLKDEIEQAILDDAENRNKKLRLLNAYRGIPDGKETILIMPLVKRAVRRNVSYMKGRVLGETPLVTVKPTSNKTLNVLVEDKTYGTVPLEKSSEEAAQAIEWWIDWKLRNKVNFAEVVEIAATEVKRGQTPTWLKITHKKELQTVKRPRFEKRGPLAVTFETKDDVQVPSGEADNIINISTYDMLMPAEEQNPQKSRWLAQRVPNMTNEAMRAALYNGTYNLIPKSEWEEFIETGAETEQPVDQKQKAVNDKRVATAPKGTHDVREVWMYITVPTKETYQLQDEMGQVLKEKTVTVNKEYSMVGHFHLKHGRLMSLIRNPRDDEKRPYVALYDRKEPFRLSGESIAEDVINHQRVESQLLSLEIRGGQVERIPIFFAEPGSVAGDWITEHEVDPGDVIPRLRPEEIEATQLGKSVSSLLGTIEFVHTDFERNTALGDLQLGLNLPGRTPASTLAQALNEGQTDSQDSLERFCNGLVEALILYVSCVQQYMRTGEVIPFDPETQATILAALKPEEQAPDLSRGMAVRFPMTPITDHFTFQMTATTGETLQADFEKYVAFKEIVDADGAQLAQVIGPLASGQLGAYPAITEALIEHVTRSQKLMKKIGDAVAKDGKSFAISPQLIQSIAREGQAIAMLQQQEAMRAAQGAGNSGQPSGVPNDPAAMGGAVPQPGVPPSGVVNQAPPGGVAVGPPA